jgi:GAF domain-containing protein/HAMP domain-containing protein
MNIFNNLRFSTKILLLGIGSVLITIAALMGTVIWQSAQYNTLAQEQFAQITRENLGNIAKGVYNTIEAQDQVVQEQANSGLNVIQHLVYDEGGARLAAETIDWTAVNEMTGETFNLELPKMLLGDTWLGQLTGRYDTTPIVDDAQILAGGNAAIYQRMNEQGDMLRVATNFLLPNGQRAIGTFTPAVNADGTPNQVVATILRNSIYRGSNYIIDAWYNTAYAPIRDSSGQVIGMLQTAMKQENVDAARQAILRAKVGETGHVDVLGSEGYNRGRYIISPKGQRDGENVWETQSADGSFPIQNLINKATTLKFGEVAVERYLWQGPDDAEPRWKIAAVTQYEPWRWVILASVDEAEILASQVSLQEGRMRIVVAATVVGVVLALVVGFLSVLVARSISRPVIHLADVAMQVSGGNLQVAAKVETRDEIGTLALAFNSMTAQLRGLIGGLEERIQARTEQLQTSAEVGRTAASVLEPDEVLRQVVNLISDRFGFYYAAVFIVDSSGRYAVLREATGAAGRTLKEQHHQLEVSGQSMVGYAITRRQPRIALDVGEDAVRFANPLLPDTRSEIALPLMVGDQVLGALDVQSTQAAAFDEASAAVLQSMADQIAIAWNNALSYAETEATARRSRALFAASSEVGQLKADLAATIQSTVRAAAETLDYDPWCVLTLNEIRTMLIPLASYNWPQATATLDIQAQPDHPLVACLEQGTELFITEADDARLSPLSSAGVNSLISVPIKTREAVVGVLAFSRAQGSALADGDLEVGRSLANLIAVAIENHALLETSQRTLRELDEINRTLTGQGWERFVRRQEKREIIWVSRSDRLQPNQTQLPEVSEALRHGHIATRTLDDEQQLGVAVPIKLRDVPVGALRLIVSRRTWNLEMATALDSIAGHVAQAAENARLIAATEERLMRERALADATEKVRQRSEVEAVLQTAATELARYLNASHITVQLMSDTQPLPGNGQVDR